MYFGNQFGLYSQRMVRNRRWKYVWNLTAEDELYNLEPIRPRSPISRRDRSPPSRSLTCAAGCSPGWNRRAIRS